MDKNKITQLSCARKLKDTDPRADMECGVEVLEGVNVILNRVNSLLYQSNEQVSLFALKAGLSPEKFVLDKNQLSADVSQAIRLYLEAGHDEITMQCVYHYSNESSGCLYTAIADGLSTLPDEPVEEDPDDGYTYYQEQIFVTLEKRSVNGIYTFTNDGRWVRNQAEEHRVAVMDGEDPDTSRGWFAEMLLDARPNMGKKMFRRCLEEAAPLCDLSDASSGLLLEDWIENESGNLIPALFPANEYRHGLFVSTKDGKYQVNACVDSDDFYWYDETEPFLRWQCIFETNNKKQVLRYLRCLIEYDTPDDTWSFPLSATAFLGLKEDQEARIYFLDGKREPTAEEQKNETLIMDWLQDMTIQMLDLSEDEKKRLDEETRLADLEDDEEEADDEDEEYEDEDEYVSEYDKKSYENYNLKMLHSLSDNLPGMFRVKWIHPTGRGRMPVLLLADENKHGLAISTEGGEYHINAHLLTLDMSWYDKGAFPYSRLRRIFSTSDIEKVKQYICNVTNLVCNTKEDTWLFPLSDQAVGKMSKYGDIHSASFTKEPHVLTNEEEVNLSIYEEWYEKLQMSSEWCDEDDELYDEDDEYND